MLIRYHETTKAEHKKSWMADRFTVDDLEWCCDKLAGEYGYTGALRLVTDSYEPPHMAIVSRSCYPSGAMEDEITISHCPFCGQVISVVDTAAPSDGKEKGYSE